MGVLMEWSLLFLWSAALNRKLGQVPGGSLEIYTVELGCGGFSVSSSARNQPVQGYLNTSSMSKLSGSITRIQGIILVCGII